MNQKHHPALEFNMILDIIETVMGFCVARETWALGGSIAETQSVECILYRIVIQWVFTEKQQHG